MPSEPSARRRPDDADEGDEGDDEGGRHALAERIESQMERRSGVLPALVAVTAIVFVIWVAVTAHRETEKSEQRFGTHVSPQGRLAVGQTLHAKVSDRFEAKITVASVAHHDKPYSYLGRSAAPGWVAVKVKVEVLSGDLPFHGEYFELEERDGARHGPLNVTGPTPPAAFEPLFPKSVSTAPDAGSGNLVFWQVGPGGFDISFPAVPDAYWSYDPPAGAGAEAAASGGTLRPGETMVVDAADVDGKSIVGFVAVTDVRAVDAPAGAGVGGGWTAVDFVAGSDRGTVAITDMGIETQSGDKRAPRLWTTPGDPVAWPGRFEVPAGQSRRGTLLFDVPVGGNRVFCVTPAGRSTWQS
jgi:hypothetical protein